MTPQRWRKIEELYNQLSELSVSEREQFLDKACAGDDELRRDVEGLLHAKSGDTSFFNLVRNESQPPWIGRDVGVHHIVSLIGSGGMGEVYQARDTRLKRDVAIKVLPVAFARDAERMARLRREAQMLAALNHPNIAAVYE